MSRSHTFVIDARPTTAVPRIIFPLLLLLAAAGGVGHTQSSPPPYYIFDTHLHASTNAKTTAFYERTYAGVCASSAGDFFTAPGATANGCVTTYYDYNLLLGLLRQNMHWHPLQLCQNASNIRRSLILGASKAREVGYAPDCALCTPSPSCPADNNCELSDATAAMLLTANTPDLRLWAARAALGTGDHDETVPTMAGFGACDSNVSAAYVAAHVSQFGWAGENETGCWFNSISRPNSTFPSSFGPTQQVQDILSILAANRVPMSTHLPAGGINYASFNTITGTCAPGDTLCEGFRQALLSGCGTIHAILHQNIAEPHWGDITNPGNQCAGGTHPAFEFLKYWFNQYDTESSGYFLIEILYAVRTGQTSPCPTNGFGAYCAALAGGTYTPDCAIDFLLDPVASRHVTIGSHQYPQNDYISQVPQGPQDVYYGPGYADWTATGTPSSAA